MATSEEIRTSRRLSPKNSREVDCAYLWTSVTQNVRERLLNIDLKHTSEECLEPLLLRSNSVRFETCWYKSDDNTPASIRAVEGPCSRQIAGTEFFKRMIEISKGWAYAIYHSLSQQCFDKYFVEWSDCRRVDRKESRLACYFSAVHPQQCKSVPETLATTDPSLRSTI